MERNRTIDAFRGLAILGMIFFTVSLKISSNLPDLLRHNVRDSVHIGDFVLPMFLFASGLSLAYYIERGKKEHRKVFLGKVMRRFGNLALVGLSLSYFSANGLLEMDEVMLIAILFLVSVFLSRLDWKILLCIVFLIDLSFLILIRCDLFDIFKGHYLGGYPAAFYYLQIMLTGLMIGKGIVVKEPLCRRNIMIISLVLLFFLLFWSFIPIEKLSASPSYMLLSILLSFLVFSVMNKVKLHNRIARELEYMGRKPLRFWIMMFISSIIPLRFWAELSQNARPLDLHWPLTVVVSMGLVVLLWGISRILDNLMK